MASIGSDAKVISSSGRWSSKFIGQTGVAVSRLNSSGKKLWVLRFPSVPPQMEEGLFDETELSWIN